MNAENELLYHLDQLHTTELGIERIKRNLSLDTDQVVEWCREKISAPEAVITKNGLVCGCRRLHYYNKFLQLYDYYGT